MYFLFQLWKDFQVFSTDVRNLTNSQWILNNYSREPWNGKEEKLYLNFVDSKSLGKETDILMYSWKYLGDLWSIIEVALNVIYISFTFS